MEQGEPIEQDDPPAFRPPPPQDDRLWRHPSELAGPPPPRSTRRRTGWPGAAASGLIGALVTVGLLAAVGAFDGNSPRREVVVREAARPTISSLSTDTSGIAAVVDAVAPAIVRLDVTGDDSAIGSGVLFRDDGHLLTNAHVVDEADVVTALLASGQSVGARVVGIDAGTDIAVVKLEGDGPWPTALLGTTEGLAVGAIAIAIGSPLGLRGTSSVTVGVISALGRQITSPEGPVLSDMVQTDAAITSGSSGGALLDGSGSVIGVTTAFAVTDPGHTGLGFATPVDVARAVAEDLIALGRARRVWFGVRGSAEQGGGGVVLAAVVEGGPAEKGGLRAGDVVRRVDGRPVGTMSSLRVSLLRHHPGETVVVVYDRDGERRTTHVTLGERSGG